MNGTDSHEPSATPGRPSEETESEGTPQAAGTKAESHTRPMGWLAIFSGLVAGLLAFGLGEPLYKLIPPELEPRDLMGTKVMSPSQDTQRVAAIKNAALAFGVLGLCLAGLLGAAGGLARWPASSPVRGGLVGLVGLGPGRGRCDRRLAILHDGAIDYPEHDLIISLAAHSLIWGLLGASAGLALPSGSVNDG